MNGWKVSDLGRVWGARIGPFTPLSEDHGGYLKVTGNRKSAAVHRLVCIAFHGAPPSPKHTVDHKDGNRKNNHADNLRWASPSEQMVNRKVGHQRRRVDYTPVEANIGGGWCRFDSVTLCADHLGLNSRGISKCLTGVLKKHGGLKFRWVEEPTIDGEEWRFLSEQAVWISTHGRSKNKNGRVFTPRPAGGGYCRVGGHFVHRLVMIAFGPEKPEWASSVDHKNRDRANNHVDNLAWSSPMMQAQNKAMCAPRLINHCKAVRMVAADGTATIFSSAKEASNQTGVGRGEISMHANGKRKRTKSGTKWEFV